MKQSKARKVMTIVAYFLCLAYISFCVFVILVFGIKFEQSEVEEWMWVCAWSMFLDIFVQQPLSTGFATFISQFDLGWMGDVLFELICCGPG